MPPPSQESRGWALFIYFYVRRSRFYFVEAWDFTADWASFNLLAIFKGVPSAPPAHHVSMSIQHIKKKVKTYIKKHLVAKLRHNGLGFVFGFVVIYGFTGVLYIFGWLTTLPSFFLYMFLSSNKNTSISFYLQNLRFPELFTAL